MTVRLTCRGLDAPPTRLGHRLALLAGACALSLSAACGSNTGIVELDWAFVDRDGEPIFPGGPILANRDTCTLSGRDANGTRDYALNVSLVIEDADCVEAFELGEESDRAACEVAREQFDCARARGAITGVPEAADPYLMRAEVWASPIGSGVEPFEVDTTCIAVPGPRTRRVQSGRISDLAVYQLVAHAINLDDSASGQLDLPGCRLLPNTDPSTGPDTTP